MEFKVFEKASDIYSHSILSALLKNNEMGIDELYRFSGYSSKSLFESKIRDFKSLGLVEICGQNYLLTPEGKGVAEEVMKIYDDAESMDWRD